jgi:hypothetical protein
MSRLDCSPGRPWRQSAFFREIRLIRLIRQSAQPDRLTGLTGSLQKWFGGTS